MAHDPYYTRCSTGSARTQDSWCSTVVATYLRRAIRAQRPLCIPRHAAAIHRRSGEVAWAEMRGQGSSACVSARGWTT